MQRMILRRLVFPARSDGSNAHCLLQTAAKAAAAKVKSKSTAKTAKAASTKAKPASKGTAKPSSRKVKCLDVCIFSVADVPSVGYSIDWPALMDVVWIHC